MGQNKNNCAKNIITTDREWWFKTMLLQNKSNSGTTILGKKAYINII